MRGLLQLLPLGGAVGCNVCLTVVGDGIVGLGIESLAVGLLIAGAVGCDVGLMVVDDGIVGLGVGLLASGSLDAREFF